MRTLASELVPKLQRARFRVLELQKRPRAAGAASAKELYILVRRKVALVHHVRWHVAHPCAKLQVLRVHGGVVVVHVQYGHHARVGAGRWRIDVLGAFQGDEFQYVRPRRGPLRARRRRNVAHGLVASGLVVGQGLGRGGGIGDDGRRVDGDSCCGVDGRVARRNRHSANVDAWKRGVVPLATKVRESFGGGEGVLVERRDRVDAR